MLYMLIIIIGGAIVDLIMELTDMEVCQKKGSVTQHGIHPIIYKEDNELLVVTLLIQLVCLSLP